MRTVLPGADWLTRAAWSLSAAVHAGVAIAFLGWAEPTSKTPVAIPVTVVTLAPASATGGAGGEDAAEIIPSAASRPSPPPLRRQPPDPAPAETAAAAPEHRRPAAQVAAAPDAEPEPPPAPAAETVEVEPAPAAPAQMVEQPLPSRKPPAPHDAPELQPSEPADLQPAAGTPAAQSQTAALPSSPTSSASTTASDAATAAHDGAEAGSADLVPARVDVAALSNPKPEYPMTSRMRGEEGTVLLEMSVTAAGTVSSVRVLKSSGYPRLDRAALEAVRSWRFIPAYIGDRPVESVVRQAITFDLER